MKKYILVLLIFIVCKSSFAQTDSTLLYLRFPIVPAFKLINVADSSQFTKDNLKKNKATVIIIFSPDCEHCQNETKELLANIKLFKKAQIIMSSPLEYRLIKEFYNNYKIANYPQITMARDAGYFFGTFYKIRSFPAIFVYNKKGNFVKAFSGSVPIAQVAEAL